MAAVAALENGKWSGKLENRCGDTSLADALRLLAGCDEFWGIESSLLHYARLFGLRCKAYFGPTHPMRLRPVEGLVEEIYYRKTVCSPCIHLVSTPPCHGDNLCMQWLFEPPKKNDPREGWIPVTVD
jgi:ADP-heptose:LPS heptosyltransferase